MWLISVSTNEGSTGCGASDDISLNSGHPSASGKFKEILAKLNRTYMHLADILSKFK
jgi:hypothetical protein